MTSSMSPSQQARMLIRKAPGAAPTYLRPVAGSVCPPPLPAAIPATWLPWVPESYDSEASCSSSVNTASKNAMIFGSQSAGIGSGLGSSGSGGSSRQVNGSSSMSLRPSWSPRTPVSSIAMTEPVPSRPNSVQTWSTPIVGTASCIFGSARPRSSTITTPGRVRMPSGPRRVSNGAVAETVSR